MCRSLLRKNNISIVKKRQSEKSIGKNGHSIIPSARWGRNFGSSSHSHSFSYLYWEFKNFLIVLLLRILVLWLISTQYADMCWTVSRVSTSTPHFTIVVVVIRKKHHQLFTCFLWCLNKHTSEACESSGMTRNDSSIIDRFAVDSWWIRKRS